MSYKRNTSDSRESPALVVAERLTSLGADLRAVDPLVADAGVDVRLPLVQLTPEEVAAADAVVVLTDHDRIDLDVVARHAGYVLDTRHALPPADNVEYL